MPREKPAASSLPFMRAALAGASRALRIVNTRGARSFDAAGAHHTSGRKV
jgi:hypothetical protein